MPVLKIQDTGVDQSHHEVEAVHSMIPEDAYRAIRKYQPTIWGRVFFGLSLIFLVVGAGFFFYQKNESPENPFVFFELRITDQQGHPVPGAQVFWKERHLGVSDSFGEWRRFMRVTLGNRVRLDIVKSYGDKKIKSRRLFQIPFVAPINGEIQMKAQVRVQSHEQPSDDVFPWDTDKDEQTSSIKKEVKWDHVWFSVQGDAFKNVLQPKLFSRARELGLKVDKKAPWRVHIKVFKNNQNYLVRVESQHKKNGTKFRFLKRVQKTPLATARKILFGLKQHVGFPYTVKRHGEQWKVQPSRYAREIFHVNPGSQLINEKSERFIVKKHDVIQENPCQGYDVCQVRTVTIDDKKTQKDLKDFNLILYGVKKPVHVFISGYYAEHKKGKVWSYRANPGTSSFVTVMDRNKILYRGRVKNRVGKPAMISVRGMTVARK
ncbi:MAG: hypothetical protein AB8C84_01830 [Oligoflexales bacterium]